MRFDKGDKILYFMFHAPGLHGVEIGEVGEVIPTNGKRYYQLKNARLLLREDQIVTKLTDVQFQRYQLIAKGPAYERKTTLDV